MFQFIEDWLNRRIIKRSTITSEQWAEVFAALPLVRGLSSDEMQRLQNLSILFCHDKIFEGARAFVVSQSMKLTIAVQACLPILELGLAWDEAEHAGIIDGHNLVIHEFAHKLDMQNGVANGFPPLHAGMDPIAWTKAFSAGFEDFQHQCSTGKNIGIDCYGASSPAEFFAVLSGVFFERPEIIQRHYAAVYEQLKQFYRQDPLSRLRQ